MKKSWICAAFAAALGVVIAFGFAGKGNARVLEVNEVGSDPSAFTGTITITGVTASVHPQDPALFAIFDRKELQCKSPNCNKILIPVINQPGAPKPGDEVRITGSFVDRGQGYFFASEKLKVVKNHAIGG